MADPLPALDAPVLRTSRGTPYLREPGVVLLARPHTDLGGMAAFLRGFDPALRFPGYLEDPDALPPAEALCKAAGQLCYASFGPRRTPNARARDYIENIRASGHGSVLEHASFSLLLYGVSRSLTHELVRHRAGTAFCLDGDTLVDCTAGPGGPGRRRLSALGTGPGGDGLRLRCLDEGTGRFTSGPVRQVTCSGERPVFRVALQGGRTITCTREHRLLTPQGWRPLWQVVGGLSVSASGRAVHGPLQTPLVTAGTVRRGAPARRPALATPTRHPAGTAAPGGGALAAAPQRALAGARGPRAVRPRPRRILAVAYAGLRPTYDLEMAGEHHNFVANGVVSHNSQLSQRYVSGRVLRFVERPEYRDDPELHALFERRIDHAAEAHAALTEMLAARQEAGQAVLSAEARTDLRKKVQQCSRSLLPNETEAPLVMTANARAWRHILEMRGSAHAEVEIRALALRLWHVLRRAAPLLFDDYEELRLPDGTAAIATPHPKV